MVFLRAIRGRCAGCDVRVFICFSFFPRLGNRARAQREISLRAQEESGVVFAPRCERRSRDFRGDLRVVDIRSRERVELCARGAMVPACLLDKRERGGVTQRGFSFFFFCSHPHSRHETFPFFLSKHTSHRKRRLKSRKSWARSKSKTARFRNGFA